MVDDGFQGSTQALDNPREKSHPFLMEWRWIAARLIFYVYLVFSLLTVVGGFLTAPVMTWYFFNDWRFWRYINTAFKLWLHGYKMVFHILSGENGGFMMDVPLNSPPHQAPNRNLVSLKATWEHGNSCNTCSNCCVNYKCPVLIKETGLCAGYNSFFWRYFNCGRFPTNQRELDYYECPKWDLRGNRQSDVA